MVSLCCPRVQQTQRKAEIARSSDATPASVFHCGWQSDAKAAQSVCVRLRSWCGTMQRVTSFSFMPFLKAAIASLILVLSASWSAASCALEILSLQPCRHQQGTANVRRCAAGRAGCGSTMPCLLPIQNCRSHCPKMCARLPVGTKTTGVSLGSVAERASSAGRLRDDDGG